MASGISIDEVLEDLRRATEALGKAPDSPDDAASLLAAREHGLRVLQQAAKSAQWTDARLSRLRDIIAAGQRSHKLLALRREAVRGQLDELRAAKYAQSRLAQGERRNGPRVSVKA